MRSASLFDRATPWRNARNAAVFTLASMQKIVSSRGVFSRCVFTYCVST
jgi:hypothetical protein